MTMTRDFLKTQLEKYPKMTLQDVKKALFQSAFGCEHLVADASAAADYIMKEAEQTHGCVSEAVEPLDGDYCRVHLDILREGLSAETFAKLFMLSAEKVETGRDELEKKIAVFMDMVKNGETPFEYADAEKIMNAWRTDGFPACHHSEAFRAEYRPAYRLMKRDFAKFLPLFIGIDNEARKKPRVIAAIEGGSASGKTTLSELLEKVYKCNVFHMDDFFLRPEQRTEARFAETGGNVDRERFLDEVLEPLSRGETVHYRAFDCGTFEIKPPKEISPKKINIIEGAYSMHPALSEKYDISAYLRISPEAQRARILTRNLPEHAEMFFSRWIPFEQKYIAAFDIANHCDIIIDIG